MELLSLVCLFVLAWSARTLGDVTGPSDIIRIKEDDEVLLPCSLDKTDLTDKVFDWTKDKTEVFLYSKRDHYNNGLPGQDKQFQGRVFHFPDQLQFGNASIVIKKTKVADSGNYTCYFPSSKSTQRIHLTVGACPKPDISSHKTNNGVRLRCEARGASPKPEVELQDSAGNPVPAEDVNVTEKKGYFDIILSGYVTLEGDYRCVVKQTESCHQIYSKDIWINPEFPTGLTIAVTVLSLLVVGGIVLLILLVSKGVIKLNCNKDQQGPTSISSNSMQPSDEDPKQPLNV